MIALVLDLCSRQSGYDSDSAEFAISRGVRQRDVLSSRIFNATLEFVFQRWKARLNHHGWMVGGPHEERLTNARYAEDML